MKLNELTAGMNVEIVSGDSNVEISSVVHDSRKAEAGSLFVAIRGFSENGNLFVPDALKKGSVAVLTDSDETFGNAAVIRTFDVRKSMAVLADRINGTPQDSLVMTGITGTNGKTTTTYMVKAMFEAAGMSCGLIGTINHIVAGKTVHSLNTTPEATDIHRYLAQMVRGGDEACVMEASSHALSLARVHGIRFRAAAFLNLTRDHLDFHGDFKSYLNAKSILFSELSGDATAVINSDDPSSEHIVSVSRDSRLLTFGEGRNNDIRPGKMELTPRGTNLELYTPAGDLRLFLPVPGRYNVWNAMAAIGIGMSCGIPLDVIGKGLEKMNTVRGRFELVDDGQDFAVIVDYAHTPDALERILLSSREFTRGRLISVFGCGGDRDRGKRPEMGGISERTADVSIVTSDNPRTEEPGRIIADILEGVEDCDACIVEPDRGEAIRRAIESAEAGDTVVIAGKGHEDYQIVGKEKRHFDDAETARLILREKR